MVITFGQDERDKMERSEFRGCCGAHILYELGTAENVDPHDSQFDFYDALGDLIGLPLSVCITNNEQIDEREWLKEIGFGTLFEGDYLEVHAIKKEDFERNISVWLRNYKKGNKVPGPTHRVEEFEGLVKFAEIGDIFGGWEGENDVNVIVDELNEYYFLSLPGFKIQYQWVRNVLESTPMFRKRKLIELRGQIYRLVTHHREHNAALK